MKAIQQIAGHVETLQTGLANNERVDVFAGACAFGSNLNGGTLPAGLSEIPMSIDDWQLYSSPCEIESGGGVIIRVPGVYMLDGSIKYPAGAGTASVTLGVSFGWPAFALTQSNNIVATTIDWWQSSQHVRYLGSGEIVRLCAFALSPIAWQWAFFRVALLGMLE